jgi:hypothetical protein
LLQVQAYAQIVPTHAVEIFEHDAAHIARVNLAHQFLPALATERRACFAVIKFVDVRLQAVRFRIVLQDFLLVCSRSSFLSCMESAPLLVFRIFGSFRMICELRALRFGHGSAFV